MWPNIFRSGKGPARSSNRSGLERRRKECSCLRPGEPVEKWIVCGAWRVLAVDIRLGEGAIWMAKGHINHQFVDATPTQSAAGLEARGPQCLLWSSRNRRHMRVSKLRVEDGTAI